MPRKVNDWIEGYLRYTDNSEPPRLYREWISVAVIAASLQRKCHLPWGPITFYPNMYIVLVGPSGKCRKGTAMGIGASFLKELGVKMAAEATTREALIRALNESSVSTIGTGQIDLHASLTIYSQELTVFLGYNNMQLISDLTDWYDCRDTWTYRTKNMGTDDIIGVWVNLIGATTPDLIQTALPRDAIGGGLASRIIFVFEDDIEDLVVFPWLQREDAPLREDLAEDLEKISMLSGPFKYTEEFLDKYEAWYRNQHANPPFGNDPNFQGYTHRRANHVLKLCMIFSASSREDRVITDIVFDRAVDLLERTEIKMPRTFSGYGTARHADTISRVMEHIIKKGEIKKSDLLSTHLYDLEYGVKSLDTILDALSSTGRFQIVHTGKDTIIRVTKNGSI